MKLAPYHHMIPGKVCDLVYIEWGLSGPLCSTPLVCISFFDAILCCDIVY